MRKPSRLLYTRHRRAAVVRRSAAHDEPGHPDAAERGAGDYTVTGAVGGTYSLGFTFDANGNGAIDAGEGAPSPVHGPLGARDRGRLARGRSRA